jgi:hypothetical protein
MLLTTLANFNALIAKIRGLCAKSVFDDTLVEPARPGISADMSKNGNDIRCRLVYLFHEATMISSASD